MLGKHSTAEPSPSPMICVCKLACIWPSLGYGVSRTHSNHLTMSSTVLEHQMGWGTEGWEEPEQWPPHHPGAPNAHRHVPLPNCFLKEQMQRPSQCDSLQPGRAVQTSLQTVSSSASDPLREIPSPTSCFWSAPLPLRLWHREALAGSASSCTDFPLPRPSPYLLLGSATPTGRAAPASVWVIPGFRAHSCCTPGTWGQAIYTS